MQTRNTFSHSSRGQKSVSEAQPCSQESSGDSHPLVLPNFAWGQQSILHGPCLSVWVILVSASMTTWPSSFCTFVSISQNLLFLPHKSASHWRGGGDSNPAWLHLDLITSAKNSRSAEFQIRSHWPTLRIRIWTYLFRDTAQLTTGCRRPWLF